jgi:prepilin-type N-terminal cleavage/methylation domain-containing protein
MICSSKHHYGTERARRRQPSSRGFTLIELVIVVAITLVLTGITVPAVQATLRYFWLRAAVSSLSGAIQSTRYQAIFHGCQYRVAFNAAAYNYTILSAAPAANGQACLGAPVQVGNAIPLAGSGVTLNTSVTLQFNPSGTVNALVGNAANIVLTQTGIANPETIQVSNNGKITVTP